MKYEPYTIRFATRQGLEPQLKASKASVLPLALRPQLKASKASVLPLDDRVISRDTTDKFLILCFVYGSISPLSNDLITIPGGMARISYLKVMIPLGLGNIVFNITLCYLIVYANAFVLSFI
jgi:hypothetical protein